MSVENPQDAERIVANLVSDLEHKAFRFVRKGFDPRTFILCVIDMDDLDGRTIAALINPHGFKEWQENPNPPKIIYDVIDKKAYEKYLRHAHPDSVYDFVYEPEPGCVRTVVMTGGDVFFTDVAAFPHFKNDSVSH